MTSFLLLRNAGAGSDGDDRVGAAVAVLRAQAEVEVATLDGDDKLQRLLDGRGDKRVVVAGGDGTLHRIVAALHSRGELQNTVLGLIPLGTGNDFARSAKIPLDAEAAARIVLDAEVRALDVVVDDLEEVAVNNVQLGIGAEASRRGAIWKGRIGRPGYAVGLLQAAAHRAFRLTVELDGEVVADPGRPILELSIGNGSSVGGGLQLNPDADPADGRLDVMIAYATGPLRRISYGIDLARARHPDRDDVLRTLGDQLTVSGDPYLITADGEIRGPEPRRTWWMDRAVLRMPLPPA